MEHFALYICGAVADELGGKVEGRRLKVEDTTFKEQGEQGEQGTRITWKGFDCKIVPEITEP